MEVIQTKLAALLGMSSKLNAARPKFIQLKSLIASGEAQADAAEDIVLDQYDEYADEVESSQLISIGWIGCWMQYPQLRSEC